MYPCGLQVVCVQVCQRNTNWGKKWHRQQKQWIEVNGYVGMITTKNLQFCDAKRRIEDGIIKRKYSAYSNIGRRQCCLLQNWTINFGMLWSCKYWNELNSVKRSRQGCNEAVRGWSRSVHGVLVILALCIRFTWPHRMVSGVPNLLVMQKVCCQEVRSCGFLISLWSK